MTGTDKCDNNMLQTKGYDALEQPLTISSVTNSHSLLAWEWKVSERRVSGQVWLSYMLISSLCC